MQLQKLIVSGVVSIFVIIISGCDVIPSAEEAAEANVDRRQYQVPKGVVTTAGDSQILIQWPQYLEGATYTLYWSNQSGLTKSNANAINVNDTIYTHIKLTNGIPYYYSISATIDNDESNLSNIVTATPDFKALDATDADPDKAKKYFIVVGDNRNTLYWEKVAGATSYSIYWSNEVTGEVSLLDNRIDFVASPFVHDNLDNGTLYNYVVVANNYEKPGLLPKVKSGTPFQSPPTTPNNITSTYTAGQLEINFKDISNAEYFILYWKSVSGVTKSDQFFDHIQAPFIHTPLKKDTTYYYSLLAVNSGGTSELSAEFSVSVDATGNGAVKGPTLGDLPITPAEPNVTLGSHQITLDWDGSDPNVLGYNIYWSTGGNGTSLTGNKISNVQPPYTHTELLNDIPVFYSLVAINNNGESAPTAETIPIIPQIIKPGVPAGITAAAADARVAISWAEVSGATSYNVYWHKSDVPAEQAIADENVFSPYLKENLQNGVNYTFEVTANNTSGESERSQPVSEMPQIPRPLAPSKINANAGNAQVELSWLHEDPNNLQQVTGYRIYWSGTADIALNSANFFDVGLEKTYLHDQLVNGRDYYYVITALNAGGESSASAKIQSLPQIDVPGAPTQVFADAGNAQVTISWLDDQAVPNYNLYWWAENVALLKSDKTVVANVLPGHSVKGLNNGSTYHFYIAAFNQAGEGVFSNEVIATPQVPPPSQTTATFETIPGDAEIQIFWEAITTATSYNLYWSTKAIFNPSETPYFGGVQSGFKHTALRNGTTYYYSISGVNAGGEGPLSNLSSAIPQVPAPSMPPTNFSAASSVNEVVITWDTTSVAGVDSYNLYWSITADATPFELIKIPGFVSGESHKQLDNGVTYYYQVTAVNAGGESPLSLSLAAIPQVARPQAPTGLTTSVISDTQVSLNWYQTTNVTYNLYRATTPIVPVNGSGINKITAARAIHMDSGLTPGTDYFYVLTAENPGGESTPSQTVSVTPNKIPAKAPTNLSAVAGDTSTMLSWQYIADPNATYTLYWTIDANIGAQLGTQLTNANTIPNVTSPYRHSPVINGNRYYYVVSAISQAESPASAVASATPQVAPVGPPSGFSVTAGVGEIIINWETSRYAIDTTFNLYWTDQPNTLPLNNNRIINVIPPFTQTGLAGNTTRTYAVTAVNAAGESATTMALSAVVGVPVNTAPIISGGTQTTSGQQTSITMSEDNSPVPFNLVLNAYDNEGDALTWSILQQPTVPSAIAKIATQSNPVTINYTPALNFNGSDTFIARVTDGKAPPSDIIINVMVNSVNDLPKFSSLPTSLEAFTGLLYSYTIEVSDIETPRTDLKIAALIQPSWMTRSETTPGVVTLAGTPGLGDLGVAGNNVILSVVDSSGGYSEQSFNINVATGVAVTAPTRSTAQIPNTAVGLETIISVQAVDENGINRTAGGDFVAVSISGSNQNPDSTPLILNSKDNGDGSYTATYIPTVIGTDSIDIAIGGAVILGSPYNIVVSQNLAPIARDDIVYTNRNVVDYKIDVLANDNDPEGGVLSLLPTSNGTFGSVVKTLNNNGDILVYTPELNRSGIDTLRYEVKDAYGNTSFAAVTINVSSWSVPIQIGNGNGMEFVSSLDGQAIALWANSESLFSRRFLVGFGWQAAIPIYTVSLGGYLSNQRVVMNEIGQALAVWKVVENSSALFGYSLFGNSQWQSFTKPWQNVNVNQDTAIKLSIDSKGMASVVWDQKDVSGNNTIFQDSLQSKNWSISDTVIAQSAIAAQTPVTVTNGARTIATWLQGTPTSVWWRFKNASNWDVAEPISDISTTASNLQIVMEQSGAGLVLWQEKDISNKITLQARPFTYPTGLIPTLGPTIQIDNGAGVVSEAKLVQNIAGDFVIVWRQLSKAGSAIWAYRSIGPNQILEKISDSNDINPTYPKVRLNDNGEIFTLWFDGDTIRFRKYQSTWQPIESLANVTQVRPDSLLLTTDGLGNAAAIWNTTNSQSSIWGSDYCNNPINCQLSTSTHQMVNQACVDCHNGTASTGKSAIHIPTMGRCEVCHLNTVAWVPALTSPVDHALGTSSCISCHDGVSALGKGAAHIATTDVCEVCHVNTVWVPVILPMDHTQVIGVCEDCHFDGGPATGPGTIHDTPCPNYINFTCGDCHNTIGWLAADPNGLCVAAAGTGPAPPAPAPPGGGGMMGGMGGGGM